MRPLPAMLLCAVFAAALSGCHRKPSLTPLQAQGKQLFDVGCAHCHVQNDQHLTPAPPDLRGLFTHNSMPDGAPATDASVEHILTTGKGSMPSFAYQMTPSQRSAVIAYLHVYAAPSHPDQP